MSKFGKFRCNFINMIYTRNVCVPSFHTSRNTVFPNLAREEKSKLDYLQCLRPAEIKVSDVPTLAGNPRIPGGNEQGLKPEIYEKWTKQKN